MRVYYRDQYGQVTHSQNRSGCGLARCDLPYHRRLHRAAGAHRRALALMLLPHRRGCPFPNPFSVQGSAAPDR